MERQLQDPLAHADADLAVRLARSEGAERRSARPDDEFSDPLLQADLAGRCLWLEAPVIAVVAVDDDVGAGGGGRLPGRLLFRSLSPLSRNGPWAIPRYLSLA